MGVAFDRRRLVAAVAALTLSAGLLVATPPAPARAQADWTVGPDAGDDFATILDALASPVVIAGDRLLVDPGTYTGNHLIDRDLTLEAAGAGFVMEGAGGSVVTVNPSVTVTISGADIVGGSGTLAAGRRLGGGIFNAGNIQLTDVRIADNTALTTGNFIEDFGGGIYSTGTVAIAGTSVFENNRASYQGGAIYNDGGLIEVAGATFSGNVVEPEGLSGLNRGGAIFSINGNVFVSDSGFYDNGAHLDGGALAVEGGFFQVVDSEFGRTDLAGGNVTLTFNLGLGGVLFANSGASVVFERVSAMGNVAGWGGVASLNDGSVLTVIDSTLSHNTAADGNGGAVTSTGAGSTLQVFNSTLSRNTATERGGAVHTTANSTVTMNNATVYDNVASVDGGGIATVDATVTLTNTVLSFNFSGPPGTPVPDDCSPGFFNDFFFSGGHNLFGEIGFCDFTLQTGDQVGVLDPQLGPLADNGGPTLTHLPIPGSPVIDAGNPAPPASGDNTCEAFDQRAVARPIGAACDIGSVEAPGPDIAVSFAVDDPTPTVAVAAVPVADLPASALTRGGAGNQGSVIANSGIDGVVESPINSIPINSIPINSIPINSIPINSIPINSIAGETLSSILLVDVPVQGGWEDLLEGSGLTAPLQAYTFFDALADPVVRDNIAALGLTLAESGLAATPINSIPISAIALGALPINSIPINSIPINSIALVEAWCDLLAGSPASCQNLGVDPQDPSTAEEVNLLGLSLAAAPINSIPINSIPINSIPINSIPINSIPINSIYVAGTPINSIFLTSTPINSIPINSIPINSIPINSIPINSIPINSIPINSIPINSIEVLADCSLVDCDDPDLLLGAVPQQAWTGTFGQLIWVLLNETDYLDGWELAHVLGQGLPDDTSLADLMALLVPPEEYPWQRIDLAAADLATHAAVPGAVRYTATIAVDTGVPANDLALRVTLPDGFTYRPGTTSYDPPLPGAPLDPDVGGQVLSWALPGVADLTTFDIDFEATTGLRLGPAATAVVAEVVAGGSAAAGAVTSLQEAHEPNDDPTDATPAQPDTIYLSHISSAGDVDLFRLPGVPAGATVTAVLAALPADYDLVVYGPPVPPLRGAPERVVTGVEDDPVDLLDATASQPEVLTDIHRLDLPVVGISTNRGDTLEQVTTRRLGAAGDYIVQVSGYNGASSLDPYTLQVEVDPDPSAASCDTVAPVGGTAGALPGSVPADVNTLFLVNRQRFEATYGAAALAEVLASLELVAGQAGLGVVGSIIPVEGDPAVAAAYGDLDAAPCSVEAANTTAAAIAALVDGYRETHDIEYVVFVGGDDQIPQFRIPDGARIANESTYAGALRGAVTPQTAALAAATYLSDDPYGDASPLLANGREIYLPDVALGRLVESPADIVATLDRFVAWDGLLDPATTSSGLVSGYDFLTDGAEAVSVALGESGRVVSNLISDAWDRADLVEALLDGAPTVASVNAHFDHNRAQPADLGDGYLGTAEVAAAAALERAIVFSMGCHSGLSIPDIQIGGDPEATDWAQTFAATGATFVGNTGFGYGETDTVALSEELLRLFAANLDGTLTVGEALRYAKHRYAGAELVYGAYDDKVLMISTLYGLPFYRVGGGGTLPPPPQPPPLGVDAATGLPAAPVSVQLDVGTDLVLHTGERGSFYSADDGGHPSTQATPFRPIQPKVEVDVTQDDLVAHGALVTGLASVDIDSFDPVLARPVVAVAANEPEPVAPGVFPAAPQAVRRYQAPGGHRDQLVLVPGQFLSTTPTEGIQRLFTGIDATVFYAPGTATDFDPPLISRATATGAPGALTFTVDVSDAAGPVSLVTALYLDGGTWTGVTLLPVGGATWSATVPASAGPKDYFVQAVDASGNVAVSSNKGTLFLSQPLAPPAPDVVTLNGDLVDGWYDGPVEVVIAVPPGGAAAYSLDGSAPQPYLGPITVEGDGIHTLAVLLSSGPPVTVGIPVDTLPPVVSSPIQGAEYPVGQAVTVSFTCSDAGSGIASCEGTIATGAPLPTSSSGAHSFSVTAVDNVGRETTQVVAYTVTGAAGPPAWDRGTVYNAPDRVTHGGKVYEAAWWTQNQEPGTSPWGPWQEIAETADGTAIWTDSRIFQAGDIAQHNGVRYKAKWWTRNQPPGDPWGPWEPV